MTKEVREDVKLINDTLVKLFNTVIKMEERALTNTSARNLSLSEIHTLVAIGIGEEKSMGEVSEALEISISTLTTAINKLVKKEYVERFKLPEDKRIVKIRLTELGEVVVREHEEFHMETAGNIIDNFPESYQNVFISAFRELNGYLDMKTVDPLRKYEEGVLKNVTVGKYTIPKGLFQGAMSVGYTMSGLASAVVLEGGVGTIAALEIGYGEKDYEDEPLLANLRALRKEIEKAQKIIEDEKAKREKKGDERPVGILAVNIPYNLPDFKEYVKVAVSAGIKMIISGGGLPMTLPGICKDKSVALVPVVSSARAANLILKNWDKKHGRRPDAFIFENAFAGGKLGYKESQIFSGQKNYFRIATEIREVAGDIPLIFAGGIVSKMDAIKAYMYGADAIQMGTAFAVTKECDINKDVKKAYLNCRENDVTIIKDLTGRPARALVSEAIKGNPVKASYDITAGLVAAAKGDLKHGLIGCGSKSYMLSEIRTVHELFCDFFDED